MQIEIKNRFTGSLIFECDAASLKVAVELAVSKRISLRGANLGGANLGGAYLGGANLGGANLRGANLGGANLRGANTNLIGDRPYFSIGPVGSRSDNLTLWITEKGPLLKTGCFGPDTFEAFRSNLEREHPVGSTHRKEYEAAILMCEAHAALWTPKSVEA